MSGLRTQKIQTKVKLRRVLRKASLGPPWTHPASRSCAGGTSTRASHLKLHSLNGQYDNTVIAVASPAASNDRPYNSDTGDHMMKYTTPMAHNT